MRSPENWQALWLTPGWTYFLRCTPVSSVKDNREVRWGILSMNNWADCGWYHWLLHVLISAATKKKNEWKCGWMHVSWAWILSPESKSCCPLSLPPPHPRGELGVRTLQRVGVVCMWTIYISHAAFCHLICLLTLLGGQLLILWVVELLQTTAIFF